MTPMSDQDRDAARQRSRVLVGAFVGLIVVAGLTGGFVGFTRHRAHHTHPLRGLLVLGGALLVMAALGGVVLWWAIGRPHTQRLMAYGWRRRFRVTKQLRRGQPVADEDWDLATAVVDAGKRQGWYLWLLCALVILFAVDGALESGGRRWWHIATAVIYLVLLPYVLWERRRIRAGYERDRARHEGLTPPAP